MVLTRQGRQIGSSVFPFLPLFLRAPVVHGKRRGGKELGIPTGKTNCVYKQFTRPVEPELIEVEPYVVFGFHVT